MGVQSVRKFKDALAAKGIRKSADGKVIDSKGKKTLDYDSFLNDFGRNINKPTSYLMSDNNKEQAIKILSESHFPMHQIQNQKMKAAYNSQSKALRDMMIKKTTPKKRKATSGKASTSGMHKKSTWEQIKRKIYDTDNESE